MCSKYFFVFCNTKKIIFFNFFKNKNINDFLFVFDKLKKFLVSAMKFPTWAKVVFPVTALVEELTDAPKATAEVKNVDVVRALSEAFVAVTQNITQGVLTNQIISINCDRKSAGEACLLCIKTLKNLGFSENYIADNCKVTCTCNIEDINMSQIVTLDLNTTLQSVSNDSFFKQFKNSIVSQTSQSGSNFTSMSSSEVTSLTSSVSNVFSKMRTTDFKEKVDQVNNLQFITLKGAGQIKNITLKTAVDFVAKCIMSTESIMSDVSEIQKQIITMTSQITKNYMLAIIELIMNVIFIIIFVFVFWTFVQLLISVFSQYSSAKSLSTSKDLKESVNILMEEREKQLKEKEKETSEVPIV